MINDIPTRIKIPKDKFKMFETLRFKSSMDKQILFPYYSMAKFTLKVGEKIIKF